MPQCTGGGGGAKVLELAPGFARVPPSQVLSRQLARMLPLVGTHRLHLDQDLTFDWAERLDQDLTSTG